MSVPLPAAQPMRVPIACTLLCDTGRGTGAGMKIVFVGRGACCRTLNACMARKGHASAAAVQGGGWQLAGIHPLSFPSLQFSDRLNVHTCACLNPFQYPFFGAAGPLPLRWEASA